MKNIMRFIGLLTISVFINSCSDTEELITADLKVNKVTNKFAKLYSKSESQLNGQTIMSQEVYYGLNNKIDSVVRNNIGYFKETFRVSYRGKNILNIKYSHDNEDESQSDETYYYNISSNNNLTTLKSSTRVFEIYHSNGFVDSIKTSYSWDDFNSVYEQHFIRNENDQLISNGEISEYNADEQIYFYSNFDSDKKPAPLNSVIEIPNTESIIFFILGLKLSKDNPLTINTLPFNDTYSMNLSYDEDGYVIQGMFNNDTSFVEYHHYIEQ